MARSRWGVTPRESIEAECARRGEAAVAAGCVALVRGQGVDPALLLALGGPAAEKFLDGAVHEDTYWLRVWGLRGLLWSWDGAAGDVVAVALDDDAWRVREMAVKVVTKHLLGEAVPALAALRNDPVPRVRHAAERALVRLTGAGA